MNKISNLRKLKSFQLLKSANYSTKLSSSRSSSILLNQLNNKSKHETIPLLTSPGITSYNFKSTNFYSTEQATAASAKSSERYEFLAETKQLLNIVAKSLYSDKEVFIRELISNASDAIEKLKYEQLTDTAGIKTSEQQIPFEIQINANDITNTLTIQDTGVGMTKAELIQNLGTIAHSGSKAFLEKLSKDNSSNQNGIIGQFGVGFYSAFMVADKVQVFSQSNKPSEKGFEWTSAGDGSYEISEADNVQRGTKIVLHLKSDSSEFSKEQNIKRIVNKYSNFVGYPIIVNGDRINLVQPIWLEDAKNVTEEQHEEFYKFLGNVDKPRFTMQYKTDAPINIRALFYVPSFKPSPVEINQEAESGVSLYSKKVMILAKANQILPRWLRFLKGVVDSEDIPLNLSRELLQDSNLIRKIRNILTARVLRFLNEKSNEDPAKFSEFYNDFNLYFKEAIMRTTEQNEKEEIASLLRFETSKTEPGVKISLSEYISKMKEDQKNIYFYAAPSRQLALNSPYFEVIKNKDYEVVFLFEPYDEMVILQLGQFKRKFLIGIEQETQTKKTTEEDDVIIEGDSRSLTNSEATELKNWFIATLSTKIKNCKITNKLDTHPCVVTTENMGVVRHLIKSNYFQREKINDFYNAISLTLEINPKNALIKSLYTLQKRDPPLAQAIAEQLLDNSLVSAGLIEDPRLVLSNLNKLLEKAFATPSNSTTVSK